MDKLISIAVILTVLVGVSNAAYCDLTIGGYTYCSDGCCGVYTITCCRSSYLTTPSSSWSTGIIVAAVIGSIISLCTVIGFIICCVIACRSGNRRTVIRQTQNQPHVMMMSTAQQSNYPMGQPYPGQPQPYPGQAPYPAQMGYTNPAFPPAQPGNASMAYPPPFAGNPPPYGVSGEPSPTAKAGDSPVPAAVASQ